MGGACCEDGAACRQRVDHGVRGGGHLGYVEYIGCRLGTTCRVHRGASRVQLCTVECTVIGQHSKVLATCPLLLNFSFYHRRLSTYLLRTTHHLQPTAGYLLLATCYLLLATGYLGHGRGRVEHGPHLDFGGGPEGAVNPEHMVGPALHSA